MIMMTLIKWARISWVIRTLPYEIRETLMMARDKSSVSWGPI